MVQEEEKDRLYESYAFTKKVVKPSKQFNGSNKQFKELNLQVATRRFKSEARPV
jgi:hypothetical protein